jgi:hypothetical protein
MFAVKPTFESKLVKNFGKTENKNLSFLLLGAGLGYEVDSSKCGGRGDDACGICICKVSKSIFDLEHKILFESFCSRHFCSKRFCSTRLERLARDKCSSLL